MELSKSFRKIMIVTAALMMTAPLTISTNNQQVKAANTVAITDINSNIKDANLNPVTTVTYKGPGKVRLLDVNGNYTNQYVNPGSKWKANAVGLQRSYSKYLIRIGNNSQWIPHEYTDANEGYQPYKVTIKYVPGYSIAVWDSPEAGRNTTGKILKHGTSWKVTMMYGQGSNRSVTSDGYVWYQLGGNQWISSKYTTSPIELS